jgi:CubicO group peptidase (beta-lactamase class C family)
MLYLKDNIHFSFKITIIGVLLSLLGCSLDNSLIDFFPNYIWEEAAPEDVGMQSDQLKNAYDEAQDLGYVDGILIVRNGKLIGERYFNGYDADTPHDIKSVSKSFLSALTGVAIHEGIINGLNEKVIPHFTEYNLTNIDERLNEVTIRDLLMMRMGIEHERYNYMEIYPTPSWIQTTLDLELQNDPGTVFSYNTYQTHLLSAILTKESGMSTMQLCQELLTDPMEITIHDWYTGPEGYYFGGNSMFFTLRDMAVLGFLFLNNGVLNGKQIVPENWVAESTTDYTNFNNRSWGRLHNYNYGYLWWLGEINGFEVFLALGYGGQFVINFPGLDLIVVTTGQEEVYWDQADVQERGILKIISDHIVPAVTTE